MKVKLYSYSGERNRIDKTLNNETELTGAFRDACDVLKPVIKVSTVTDIFKYNYCYIPELKRYYFITGVTIIRNGLYELSLYVDVLYTYKTEIENMNGVISEHDNSNPYYNGANYSTDVRENVTTFNFENNFNENGQIVLVAVGSNM